MTTGTLEINLFICWQRQKSIRDTLFFSGNTSVALEGKQVQGKKKAFTKYILISPPPPCVYIYIYIYTGRTSLFSGGGGMGIGDSGARDARTFVHNDSNHACTLQEFHRKVCVACVSLSSLACGYET